MSSPAPKTPCRCALHETCTAKTHKGKKACTYLGSRDDGILSKKLHICKCCSRQETARKSAEDVSAKAAKLVMENTQLKKAASATACAVHDDGQHKKRKKVTGDVQIITPFENGDAYKTHLADCGGNHPDLLTMALEDVRRLAGERGMVGVRACALTEALALA